MSNNRFRGVLYAIAPIALLLAVWQICVASGSRQAFLLSRPSEIVDAAKLLLVSAQFWTDFWTTTRTLVTGYVLGAIIGFVIGVAIWFAGRYARIFEAYLVGLGSIPIFALAPLLIFVFGIGSETRFIIVFLSVLIPTALAAYLAAADIERQFSDLFKSLQANRMQALTNIVAPGAFYLTLPSLKAASNAALVATFLSEWISAQNGLAKFVLASMSIYDVPAMWVGLATFVLLGIAFSGVISVLEHSLTGWRRPVS